MAPRRKCRKLLPFFRHIASAGRQSLTTKAVSLVREDGEPPVIAGNGLGATHEIGFGDHSDDMTSSEAMAAGPRCDDPRSRIDRRTLPANIAGIIAAMEKTRLHLQKSLVPVHALGTIFPF